MRSDDLLNIIRTVMEFRRLAVKQDGGQKLIGALDSVAYHAGRELGWLIRTGKRTTSEINT